MKPKKLKGKDCRRLLRRKLKGKELRKKESSLNQKKNRKRKTKSRSLDLLLNELGSNRLMSVTLTTM